MARYDLVGIDGNAFSVMGILERSICYDVSSKHYNDSSGRSDCR